MIAIRSTNAPGESMYFSLPQNLPLYFFSWLLLQTRSTYSIVNSITETSSKESKKTQ